MVFAWKRGVKPKEVIMDVQPTQPGGGAPPPKIPSQQGGGFFAKIKNLFGGASKANETPPISSSATREISPTEVKSAAGIDAFVKAKANTKEINAATKLLAKMETTLQKYPRDPLAVRILQNTGLFNTQIVQDQLSLQRLKMALGSLEKLMLSEFITIQEPDKTSLQDAFCSEVLDQARQQLEILSGQVNQMKADLAAGRLGQQKLGE